MAGKEVRAGKAYVELAMRDRTQEGLNRAAKRMQAFGMVIGGLGAGMTAASGAVLAPVAAMVNRFSEVGDIYDKMAARTGASVEWLSAMGHAAGQSGSSLQSVGSGIRFMQRFMVEAQQGGALYTDTLDRLGVSLSELGGMTPEQQFERFAGAIASLEDPAARTASAMEVFGRGGTDLLPLLNEGADGIAALRDEAAALGIVMSREDATAAAALNDAMARTKTAVTGVALKIGGALAPAATELADQLTELVKPASKWISENKVMVVSATVLAGALGFAGVALTTLGMAFVIGSIALRGWGQVLAGVMSPLRRLGESGRRAVASLTKIGTAGQAGLRGVLSIARRVPGAIAAAGREGLAAWGTTAVAMVRRSEIAGRQIAGGIARGVRAAGATAGLASGLIQSLRLAVPVARAVFARIAEYGRAVAPMLVGATRPLVPAWQAVTQRIGSINAAVTSRVASAWGALKARMATSQAAVGSQATSVAQRIGARWTVVSSTIGSHMERAKQAINAKWIDVQVMGVRATARINGAWQKLPAWVRGPLARVAAMAREDAGRVGSAIGRGFQAAVPMAGRAWQAIRGRAVGAANTIATRFSTGLRRSFAGVQVAGVRTFAAIRAAGISAASGINRSVRGIGGGLKRMGGGLVGVAAAATAFTPLGPVFSMLLTVLPAVGGALGAVGAVLLSLASPVGLLVGGLVALGAAWFTLTDAGKAAGSALLWALQSVFGVAKDTVMGIAGALASGDLKGAAQIAAAGFWAVWWTAAAAVARIWPTIAAGAADVWKRITTAASAAAAWVAGVWAQLPGWLTGSLGAVGSAVSGALGPVLTWLGERFAALWTWAKETVGGIAQAIMSGQWGTAAEIAWVSIKQAFAAGASWLQQTWDELTTGLGLAWDSVVATMRNAWSGVVSWIAQQLVKVWGLIQSAIAAVEKFDPTGLAAKLKEAISIDVDGTLSSLQDDQRREASARGRETQQRADARGAGLLERQRERQQQMDGLAKQRAALLKSVSGAGGGIQLPGLADLVDRARSANADLTSAIATSKARAGTFDPDATGADDVDAAGMADVAKAQVRGTFSAAAVAGMGADSLSERTAKATEAVAENTKVLVKEARKGGLVFAQ